MKSRDDRQNQTKTVTRQEFLNSMKHYDEIYLQEITLDTVTEYSSRKNSTSIVNSLNLDFNSNQGSRKKSDVQKVYKSSINLTLSPQPSEKHNTKRKSPIGTVSCIDISSPFDECDDVFNDSFDANLSEIENQIEKTNEENLKILQLLSTAESSNSKSPNSSQSKSSLQQSISSEYTFYDSSSNEEDMNTSSVPRISASGGNYKKQYSTDTDKSTVRGKIRRKKKSQRRNTITGKEQLLFSNTHDDRSSEETNLDGPHSHSPQELPLASIHQYIPFPESQSSRIQSSINYHPNQTSPDMIEDIQHLFVDELGSGQGYKIVKNLKVECCEQTRNKKFEEDDTSINRQLTQSLVSGNDSSISPSNSCSSLKTSETLLSSSTHSTDIEFQNNMNITLATIAKIKSDQTSFTESIDRRATKIRITSDGGSTRSPSSSIHPVRKKSSSMSDSSAPPIPPKSKSFREKKIGQTSVEESQRYSVPPALPPKMSKFGVNNANISSLINRNLSSFEHDARCSKLSTLPKDTKSKDTNTLKVRIPPIVRSISSDAHIESRNRFMEKGSHSEPTTMEREVLQMKQSFNNSKSSKYPWLKSISHRSPGKEREQRLQHFPVSLDRTHHRISEISTRKELVSMTSFDNESFTFSHGANETDFQSTYRNESPVSSNGEPIRMEEDAIHEAKKWNPHVLKHSASTRLSSRFRRDIPMYQRGASVRPKKQKLGDSFNHLLDDGSSIHELLQTPGGGKKASELQHVTLEEKKPAGKSKHGFPTLRRASFQNMTMNIKNHLSKLSSTSIVSVEEENNFMRSQSERTKFKEKVSSLKHVDLMEYMYVL